MKTIFPVLVGAALVGFLSLTFIALPLAAQGADSSTTIGNDTEFARVQIASFSKRQVTNRQFVKGHFSNEDTGSWEEISFKGRTSYQLVQDNEKGTVLQGASSGTASAIGKSIRINLMETPWLNWTWKIDNRLDSIDETSRGGDDFAARIYVVKKAGIFGFGQVISQKVRHGAMRLNRKILK